ncbi:two-component system OmpR family response regulator [Breoghania corrubedonensis]|uniref:Two-component system OmpR family response regulator n=1 Tax=Breoghania corrubedonensis TaxID=665038 RepID=A0A2T5UYH3_9HYPH|nr:response regulator transcription factor [Breoghania corrubedonensis]PTW56548.1 two-component system OmpR family response regulator [Breoghania corrubedonensis]
MSHGPFILVVDDDQEIRSLLGRYLADQGFRVSVAASRRECENRISEAQPDLVVLDVMLPDGSGLDICRNLRSRRPSTPVILLTALKEDVDRIIGLEIGADDYLGKPFNPRELTARIKAVLRRAGCDGDEAETVKAYRLGDILVEPEARQVTREPSGRIDLTGAEFDLLRVFLDRPGRLLSREQLLDITQGRHHEPGDRSIDVLMSRLRRKLGEGGRDTLFRTVRNGGYQLVVPVTSETEAE